MEKTKTYKVHYSYIIVVGLFLFGIGYSSIREIIDPSYYPINSRYVPRPIGWFFVILCWYKFLTTVYKVEIAANGTVIATSLFTKFRIETGDVISIKSGMLFVSVILRSGKLSFSTLIDGTPNIKNVLESCKSVDQASLNANINKT